MSRVDELHIKKAKQTIAKGYTETDVETPTVRP